MFHQHHQRLAHSLMASIARRSLLLLFILFSSPILGHAQAQNLRDLYESAVNAYSHQQFDQAIEFYQKILNVVPTFAPAYNGMALANQAASGDENKTIEYLKTAISYDPKMAQAYDNLGRIYYSREDVPQAEKYFEKAVSIDPTLTSAQICLGWINLLVNSKPRTAIKYFRMALAGSQDPKLYYGLGQAYFASNQREETMSMITKLRDLGEEDMASRLEKSLRDNAQVDTGTESNATPTQPAGLGPLAPTPDQPTGMKARLRGKLSDY